MKAVLLTLAMAWVFGCGNSHNAPAAHLPSTDYTVFHGHIYCPSAKLVYIHVTSSRGWAEVCEWDCAHVTHPSIQTEPAQVKIFYWLERNANETWEIRLGCKG